MNPSVTAQRSVKAQNERRHVLRDSNGLVWISQNSAYLPEPPAFPINSFTTVWPYMAKTPQRVDDETAWLAFSLQKLPNRGSLFSCLDFFTQSIPVETTEDGQYALASSIRDRWIFLESWLANVAKILLTELSKGSMTYVKILGHMFPRFQNYDKKYKDARSAQRQAKRALLGFRPLLALVSFVISQFRPLEDPPQRWIVLLHKQNVSADLIDQLQASNVANFGPYIRRVGGFVGVEPNSSMYRHLLIYNVPCWYVWDSELYSRKPAAYGHDSLIPTQEELDAAVVRAPFGPGEIGRPFPPVVSLPDDGMVQTDELDDPWTAPPSPPRAPLPKKKYYDSTAKQYVGESIDDFFARRDEMHRRVEASESPQERRTRLDQGQRHGNQIGPSKKSKVFLWEERIEIDEQGRETRFWLREHVARLEAEDVWGLFSIHQRRYNSFENEWDLCKSWGEDPDDSDSDDHYVIPSSKESDQVYRDGSVGWSSEYQADASASYTFRAQILERIMDDDKVYSFELIEDLASQRYGFKPDPLWDEKNPRWTLEADDKAKLLKVLGGNDGVATDRLLKELDGFLQRVESDRDGELIFDEFQEKIMTSSLEAVKIVIQGGQSRYRLYPKIQHESSSTLHLLVQCPVTVIECLMRGISNRFASLTDIAYTLRSRGSPFVVVNYWPNIPAIDSVPQLSIQQPQSTGDMLGYRSGDWTPTVADYEAYLIRRHAVLAKKGGIAITMGGIIWRMAYEFMELDYDYYDAEPTESQRGLELKCEFGVYSGVTLTEEELDILCGTYKVYTETGHLKRKHEASERQTSLTSWWPRVNQWNDAGYWTRGDEEWYQKRSKAILSGLEKPKTASQWKKITRWSPRATSLRKSLDERSVKILDEFL